MSYFRKSTPMTGRPIPNRQVIVTGATGFVGSYVVPELLKRGYKVVAMARDESKARQLDWFDRVRFISLDLCTSDVSFEPDAGAGLIHLAWPGLPNYHSPFHFEENLPQSYAFMKRMLIAGVSQVLVTGTCFEYGLQEGPLAASSHTMPTNPYGFAKDALRRQLEFLQKELPYTLQWARLFYMHGKGQHPRSLLAQLDAAIDHGATSFGMSGGEQLRDYLPVGEVARQLVSLFQEGLSGTFNVCSGVPISIRRLVEERIAARGATIAMNLGHYPYPDYEPMAFWGAPHNEVTDA